MKHVIGTSVPYPTSATPAERHELDNFARRCRKVGNAQALRGALLLVVVGLVAFALAAVASADVTYSGQGIGTPADVGAPQEWRYVKPHPKTLGRYEWGWTSVFDPPGPMPPFVLIDPQAHRKRSDAAGSTFGARFKKRVRRSSPFVPFGPKDWPPNGGRSTVDPMWRL